MTRYEKIKQIIESVPEKDRRICLTKQCACTGCLSSKGIREHELRLYSEGKLKIDRL